MYLSITLLSKLSILTLFLLCISRIFAVKNPVDADLEASQRALFSGNYPETIEYSTRVLRRDRGSILAYTYRGTAYTEQQKWDLALKDFTRACLLYTSPSPRDTR